MCYFLEGRLDEAEAALDRALAISPDMNYAQKWKAVVVASQGKDGAALRLIRRLREVEPEISLDQHIRQMVLSRKLGDRADEPTAILRRLWQATESDP
jgi:tetratricopeptide (TPR) repeat protein